MNIWPSVLRKKVPEVLHPSVKLVVTARTTGLQIPACVEIYVLAITSGPALKPTKLYIETVPQPPRETKEAGT